MNYEFLDRALVRIPLHPARFYHDFFAGDTGRNLLHLVQDELFLHALYLASPQLYQVVKNTSADALLEDSRKARKLRATLMKYIIRMSSRCTPFGLFAGCAVASLDDQHRLLVDDPAKAQVHARLDIHYLFFLVKKIEQFHWVKPYLTYSLNTSLYRLGNSFRYIECHYKYKKRKFGLVSITANPYIETIINFVTSHPGSSLQDIAASIVADDIEEADARLFVEELFNGQILVSNLELCTTGDEMLNQLIHSLEQMQLQRSPEPDHLAEFGSLIRELLDIRENLAALATDTGDAKIRRYQLLKDKAAALDDSFDEQFFIQTDMVTPYRQASIDKAILPDLQKGLDIVQRFSLPRKNKMLERFITAFESRYESRAVPLVEALDIESGIGYGKFLEDGYGDISPLIEDVYIGKSGGGQDDVTLHRQHASFWIKKINEAIRQKQKTVQLTDADLEAFPPKPERLTATYALLTALYKDHNDQTVIHFKGASGPTAATWLGRFCSINAGINDLVTDIAAREKAVHSDKLVAEITHLPDARIGNVVQRPALREYEIPYLSGSPVPFENQLSINDLMLVMRSGRLVLYSRRHHKEVMPYITNAHYYGNGMNLPLYHFLGDMQEMNGLDTSRIDFKDIQPFFLFMPRIQYKNLILRRACWQFGIKELQPLFDASDHELTEAFARFAKTYELPRYFSYAHSDNELVIDSHQADTLRILMNEIRGLTEVALSEVLSQEFQSLVRNENNEGYNNETLFMVAKTTTTTAPVKPVKLPHAVKDIAVREFLPGSQWIYFNLYTGFKQADEILLLLQPYIKKFRAEGLIDKWFFIRYYDPRFHLRLRFHLSSLEQREAFLNSILPVLYHFREGKLIWKLTQETYVRELERYGQHTIEILESLFHRDSDMCAGLLHYCKYKGTEKDKWMAALLAMDNTLNLFQLSLAEKQEFTKKIAAGFGREFGTSKITQGAIDRKYRQHSRAIYDLLQAGSSAAGGEMEQIIHRYSAHGSRLVQELKQLDAGYGQAVIDSIIHMSINRLFRSRQRIYEFVLYELLSRTYTSMVARSKASRVAT
jgi:thiopeptide-type bacteriocin biosynthesis protein